MKKLWLTNLILSSQASVKISLKCQPSPHPSPPGGWSEEEKRSSDNERDAINVFDSKSPVFLACVLALSFFLFINLVGGKLSYFIAKHLYKKQDTRLMVTDSESSTTEGN